MYMCGRPLQCDMDHTVKEGVNQEPDAQKCFVCALNSQDSENSKFDFGLPDHQEGRAVSV